MISSAAAAAQHCGSSSHIRSQFLFLRSQTPFGDASQYTHVYKMFNELQSEPDSEATAVASVEQGPFLMPPKTQKPAANPDCSSSAATMS